MRRYFIQFLHLLVLLQPSLLFAHITEEPSDKIPHTFKDPFHVVNIFLSAVDRGELLYFGRKITRNEIRPIQVEYVYRLDDPEPLVEIYVEFKTPRDVPEQSHCRAVGISAILDTSGVIVDSTLHLWPVDETR